MPPCAALSMKIRAVAAIPTAGLTDAALSRAKAAQPRSRIDPTTTKTTRFRPLLILLLLIGRGGAPSDTTWIRQRGSRLSLSAQADAVPQIRGM
jgi:hypothetical protein